MLCKVIKNCTVVRDDENHYPESQPFEVDDSAAKLLIAEGLLGPAEDVVMTYVSQTLPENHPLVLPIPVTMVESTLDDVQMAHDQVVDNVVELSSLTSVTDATLEVLVDAGIDSVELLAAASAEDLVALKGIGSTRARRLIEEATQAME